MVPTIELSLVSFDEFYEAKNDSKYLAKYSIDDKSDGSRDLLAEKVDIQILFVILYQTFEGH